MAQGRREEERRRVPAEIRGFVDACTAGEDYSKALSAVSGEELRELFFGVDWGDEAAGPILQEYRNDARRAGKKFNPWIPYPVPELPPEFDPVEPPDIHPLPGRELYEWLERRHLVKEFRELIRCCCWWCCCCGCADCWPPRLCRCICCYPSIRVYPRDGASGSAVYARSLRFFNAQVEAGSPSSEANITIPDAGAAVDTLDGRVTAVEGRADALETSVGDVETAVGTLEGRADALETSVGNLESRVTQTENDVAAVDTRADTLETNQGTLETGLGNLETNQGTLEGRVTAAESDLTALQGAEPNNISDPDAAELTGGGVTELHTHRIGVARRAATGTGGFGATIDTDPTNGNFAIEFEVGPWPEVDPADIHVSFTGMVDDGAWIPVFLSEWKAESVPDQAEPTNPDLNTIKVWLRLHDINGTQRNKNDTFRYRLDVFA